MASLIHCPATSLFVTRGESFGFFVSSSSRLSKSHNCRASLQMLKGSSDVYLSGPIRKYITDRGGRFHLRWGCREILYDKSADGSTYITGLSMSKATNKKIVKADAYVAACDVPGIKRLIPSESREHKFFKNICELVGVPVVTVQLRYNGWVTELQDLEKSRTTWAAWKVQRCPEGKLGPRYVTQGKTWRQYGRSLMLAEFQGDLKIASTKDELSPA